MAIIVVLNSSCGICKPPRNNREMEQRVRKHDNKRFISKTDSVRTTLVKVNRTIRYNQGLFITDNGDTIKRNFYGRLKVDSCYIIKII